MHFRALLIFAFAAAGSCHAAQTFAGPTDELLRGFVTPPASVMPALFGASVSGESIRDFREELRWRNHIGITGRDCSEQIAGKPDDAAEKRAPYMSAAWKETVREQARLAAACGVDLTLYSEPGFSGGLGGPWVQPHQAMKKLVWSETVIEGGRKFRGVIARPPDTTGPFQNTPVTLPPFKQPTGKDERYYADAAVIAYRLRGSDASAAVRITSSAGSVEAALLDNRDVQREVLSLPAGTGGAWIQFAYEQPQVIRTVILSTAARGFPSWFPGMTGQLEAQSPDGEFSPVATLNISGGLVLLSSVPQVTVSFQPVKSRLFRLTLSYPPPFDLASIAPRGVRVDWLKNTFIPPVPTHFSISQVALLTQGRVNEVERKAGFAIAQDYYAIQTPDEAGNAAIPTSDVIDLTDRMAPDGTLEWAAPRGRWRVLRLGYSLVGTLNHIVPAEAAGLEVDLLSRRHVRDYLNSYLDLYREFLSPSLMGQQGVRTVLTDSAETGVQNWTEDMLAQFQRLRGYDARPWLPALTGVIVQNAKSSDRFLWDFRQTIAQLLTGNYYAQSAEHLRQRGLKPQVQALEHSFRPQLGDDLDMRRYADEAGGTMWMDEVEQGLADIRGAASAAHLYGRNIVHVDAFSTNFGLQAFAPRDLKPVADLELAAGANRFWGFPGQRVNTWAEDAGPWQRYLARSFYLLQQGRFAADVAYFYGEEAPIVTLAGQGKLNDVPKKFAYDFVNAAALLELFDVENGMLVTPTGMRYRILQLGGTSSRMTVPVLRKLKELVRKGAIIAGPPPVSSPSLSDDDTEFQALVTSLWNQPGKVFKEGTADGVLQQLGVSVDFEFDSSHSDADILYLHRKLEDGEAYFLSNRKDRAESIEARFRVTGKAPELWQAESGDTTPVSYRIQEGRTAVPLQLEPWGSVFVVFRRPAQARQVTLPEIEETVVQTLSGPWQVSFQADRGAPPTLDMPALTSWSEHPDTRVKYFSGSAVYKKVISMTKREIEQAGALWIDLGKVDDLAQVTVNGKNLGVVWHPPYKVDATGALRPGKNTLEIKVTNMWVNRMVGDAQPDAAKKYADAAAALGWAAAFGAPSDVYTADTPLRSSGLLGPVRVNIRRNVPPGSE